MPTSIQLIVGLGNPGAEYAHTRHNVGAWFVDLLAQEADETLRRESKFQGYVTRLTSYQHPIWLLIPTTYMNESGQAVAALAKFYKIAPESILIVHDELDFAPGTIRIKKDGGHGGHNGLRSIIAHLHTRDFFRMRVGIGHPGHKDQVTPYVLHEPSRNDKERIIQSIEEGVCVIPDLVAGNIEKAFHYLHSD